jgi:hypothetical protein
MHGSIVHRELILTMLWRGISAPLRRIRASFYAIIDKKGHRMNDILPCLGVVGSLIIIFGFLAFLRYMNYKETIALAEKGLSRPETRPGKALLRWGIVISSLGLALTIGLYLAGFASAEQYPLHLGPWMLGGFVPLFLGLGLVLLHYLTEKE